MSAQKLNKIQSSKQTMTLPIIIPFPRNLPREAAGLFNNSRQTDVATSAVSSSEIPCSNY